MKPHILKIEDLPAPPYRLTRAILHEKAVAFAEAEFARQGGVSFMWLLFVPHQRKIVWIDTPWENEAEKIGAIAVLRGMIRDLGVEAYASIMEAWSAMETVGHETGLAPSERPASERDDILMIASFDAATGTNLVSRWLVNVRPPGGGLNYLGPRVDLTDDEAAYWGGRMFNLLARKENQQ